MSRPGTFSRYYIFRLNNCRAIFLLSTQFKSQCHCWSRMQRNAITLRAAIMEFRNLQRDLQHDRCSIVYIHQILNPQICSTASISSLTRISGYWKMCLLSPWSKGIYGSREGRFAGGARWSGAFLRLQKFHSEAIETSAGTKIKVGSIDTAPHRVATTSTLVLFGTLLSQTTARFFR